MIQINKSAIKGDSPTKNLSVDQDGCLGDVFFLQKLIHVLSEEYNVIIFTAKVKPDRPLVNGKTGYELVKEWLTEHDVLKYVDEITYEKPRAEYYIDDKGIKFENNWNDILEEVL